MSDKGNKTVTARIDPKLKVILTIISTIDNVSFGDLLERAFWGKESGDDKENNTTATWRVEEPKRFDKLISNQKKNISARIDKKLYTIIDQGAKRQKVTKIAIIENALWDYVEKEGFKREPVTADFINISIELPGRFKDFTGDV